MPDKTREYLLEEYSEIGFAPTNNRRVIGSMNDLAFHYDYLVSEAGSVHSADVPGIIRDLNGMLSDADEHADRDRTGSTIVCTGQRTVIAHGRLKET